MPVGEMMHQIHGYPDKVYDIFLLVFTVGWQFPFMTALSEAEMIAALAPAADLGRKVET